ncbi:MAG: ribonuclease E/G [Stellaceae bacterium]
MSGELLIACSPGEVWAALVQDGELAALRVLRAGAGARAGAVFFGRVVALKPELPAALVDIGVDRAGFLSAEDAGLPSGISALHEGQAVIVQVTKEARADKATGLSMRLRLAGRLLELAPGRPGIGAHKMLGAEERQRLVALLGEIAQPGEGFILRQAASGASAAMLAQDAETLRARWRRIEAESRAGAPPRQLDDSVTPVALALEEFAPALPDAIVLDERAAYAEARHWLARHHPDLAERLSLHRESAALFDERGIAGEVAAVLAPDVPLAEGGAITIEQTAAATMIDVDMGSTGGRGRDAERAILGANVAAAKEVARQIRLRGLAGPIVVDFIGMRRREQRERVRETLAAALAGEAELLGWTRLGHFELVRQRRQAPLAELLFERAADGGRVKTSLTVALEAVRAMAQAAAAAPPRAPSLHLHPEVAAALDGPGRMARQELERRLGRPIGIVSEPARARETFEVRLG